MEEYVLLKWIVWSMGLIFTIAFLYYTFFKHGMRGIIYAIVKKLYWIIGLIFVCIAVSFLIGTFDAGKWYDVDSFGFSGVFFVWFGFFAGLIVGLIIVLWDCLLYALCISLFGLVMLLLYPFGVRFNIGKFKTYKVNTKKYNHVSSNFSNLNYKRNTVRC